MAEAEAPQLRATGRGRGGAFSCEPSPDPSRPCVCRSLSWKQGGWRPLTCLEQNPSVQQCMGLSPKTKHSLFPDDGGDGGGGGWGETPWPYSLGFYKRKGVATDSLFFRSPRVTDWLGTGNERVLNADICFPRDKGDG